MTPKAFIAPLIATVATGIPGGICTIANNASIPSKEALMGTPITGIGVMAAITPGKWAAIPAPAIITSIPRPWAFKESLKKKIVDANKELAQVRYEFKTN